MMQRFKQFDVALAKFKNYPLWPVKIMQIGKDSHGKPTYLVFCYGSHDEFRLIDANLVELDNTPEIYETLSKTFLALKAIDKLGSDSVSSSSA